MLFDSHDTMGSCTRYGLSPSAGFLFPRDIVAEPKTITGINLPTELHLLLRQAARGKQRAVGGRASVSRLLAELIEKHRPELERLAAVDRLGERAA